MLGDEEDRLFAEEMAQSTRRFNHARETYNTVHDECGAARARAKRLSDASALLSEASRGLRTASASLREYCKRSAIRARLRGFRDG